MAGIAKKSFGSPDEHRTPDKTEVDVVDLLALENTHQAGNTATAVNPETFSLISAGKDGVFGTSDDVSNFTGGL